MNIFRLLQSLLVVMAFNAFACSGSSAATLPSQVIEVVRLDLGQCATQNIGKLQSATIVVPKFSLVGDAYIINYNDMYDACPEMIRQKFSGSGGTTLKIVVFDGNRARVVWDDQVYTVSVRKKTIVLGLHGSFCGRIGAAGCNLALTWKNNRLQTKQLR